MDGKLKNILLIILVLYVANLLLSGGISALFNKLLVYAVLVPVLLYSVIFHEIAHGWVAYLFGDPTAKRAGRLTLNPLPHIDWLGLLMLIFAHFGWAKPVPVNFNNIKNKRLGMFCVAFAGPLANIIIAAVVLFILLKFFPHPTNYVEAIIAQMLILAFHINIILASFNLIPIPPLDGSRMVAALSDKFKRFMWEMEDYGFIVILILLWTGLLDPVIRYIAAGLKFVILKYLI